uniref:Uncharacterized protein n=1 Tax=viral metagenome TaxID=1070528 RepID=A0A6C0EL30_9ZZZZ
MLKLDLKMDNRKKYTLIFKDDCIISLRDDAPEEPKEEPEEPKEEPKEELKESDRPVKQVKLVTRILRNLISEAERTENMKDRAQVIRVIFVILESESYFMNDYPKFRNTVREKCLEFLNYKITESFIIPFVENHFSDDEELSEIVRKKREKEEMEDEDEEWEREVKKREQEREQSDSEEEPEEEGSRVQSDSEEEVVENSDQRPLGDPITVRIAFPHVHNSPLGEVLAVKEQ